MKAQAGPDPATRTPLRSPQLLRKRTRAALARAALVSLFPASSRAGTTIGGRLPPIRIGGGGGLDPHANVRVYGTEMTAPSRTVHQLRVVVEAADFDEAVRLYRDVLGLDELDAFEGEGEARVVILDAGRATLELANPAQVDMIDEVEVGHRISPHIRIAFEVDDAAATTDRLVAGGATLIAGPVETPWKSSNSRLSGAGGLQLTLFAEQRPDARPPAGN